MKYCKKCGAAVLSVESVTDEYQGRSRVPTFFPCGHEEAEGYQEEQPEGQLQEGGSLGVLVDPVGAIANQAMEMFKTLGARESQRMTLRDEFAARVLPGLIERICIGERSDDVCIKAYAWADSMLAARK